MSSRTKTSLQTDTIIQCNGLGKCYKIYDNPKDRLKQALWRGRRKYFRDFWSLRNISFEVKRGESLGIIGRNGSGKSTLLQLICGTLNPTEGTVETKGRVAALLELGSGFNPEFTGLENVYLNASMLGLSKDDIEARIEDILSFADIGTFIHQPVKSYSSGMAVRLAFAVVANVDADILVVDEALAVGDTVFVQRCMRFIRRMREQRCLLFVSHDAEAVKSLCSHSLWLSNGRLQGYGDCKSVCLDYLRYCMAQSYGDEVTVSAIKENREPKEENIQTGETGRYLKQRPSESFYDYGSEAVTTDNLDNAGGWMTGGAKLISIIVREVGSDFQSTLLRGGEEAEVIITAEVNEDLESPIIGFVLKDRLGQALLGENTYILKETEIPKRAIAGDKIVANFRLWFPMLPSGEYTLMASIADGDLGHNTQHHWVDDAIVISVSSSRVRYGLTGAFISHVSMDILTAPGQH